jgi:hypothetical protein
MIAQGGPEGGMAKVARTASAPFDREGYLSGLADPVRREDMARLIELFTRETGWEPRLWEPSMVGFGRYAYRYASGQSGESLVVGFAARSQEIALYGLTTGPEAEALLRRLGLHRTGKACLYIRRLAAVDVGALRALIRAGVAELSARWPVDPA